MTKLFRDEVFALCQYLKNSPISKDISKIITEMNTYQDLDNLGNGKRLKLSYASLSSAIYSQKLQFLEYLLADDYAENINKDTFFGVLRLNCDKRKIIESAFLASKLFLDSCLKEIFECCPKASILLDPYSMYQNAIITTDAESLLEEKQVDDCAMAFKEGKLYKRIFDSKIFDFINDVDSKKFEQLVYGMKRQYDSDEEVLANDVNALINKINMNINVQFQDIVMLYLIIGYSLRSSLEMAVEMIYRALIGDKMIVMNEDNIISIKGKVTNVVYNKYTVLVQDALLGSENSGIGNIALLTCEPRQDYKIKEFGKIVGVTTSFVSELGCTSKISMITVDEDLNPMHNMTNALMNSKIQYILKNEIKKK